MTDGAQILAAMFAEARAEGRAVLMPYLTAGIPTVESSVDLFVAMAEAVAARDTAAAWLMMGAANTTFDLRLATETFVEEVYGDDQDAVVCETFNKPLQAVSADLLAFP